MTKSVSTEGKQPQGIGIIATVMVLWGIIFTGIAMLGFFVHLYLLVLLIIAGIALIAGGWQLTRLSFFAREQALFAVWLSFLGGNGIIAYLFLMLSGVDTHEPEAQVFVMQVWYGLLAWITLTLLFCVGSTIYLNRVDVKRIFHDGK